MKNIIRVAIIEPSRIIQNGLRSIIEQNPSFTIVGELEEVTHLEEKMAALRADVVLLNPSIIDFHRRNSLKSLFPDTIILAILYSHIEHDILKQFNGIIDIYDDPTKIINRLTEAVSEGATEESNADNDLSEREKEILIAVAKGMMNKEIATLHNISIHTVISHRKNISRKTGIKSVSGFVVYALLNNLLEQSDLQ